MTIVYSDYRLSDEQLSERLVAANVKIAALAFALACARPWIAWDVDHDGGSEQARIHTRKVLADIDSALDGTIHSFSKNGPVR